MTRSSRLGTPGLLLRHLRSGALGSLLVAVLIAAAVLAVALAPRAIGQLGTRELRHGLAQESPALLDLTGAGQLGIVTGLPASASLDELVGAGEERLQRIPEDLPAPLSEHVGPTQWVVSTTRHEGFLPHPLPLTFALTLSADLRWLDRIRFVSGSAPVSWDGTLGAEQQPPIPVAISSAAADKVQLVVGDVVGYGLAPVLITGIYEPTDPDDAYWVHESELARPMIVREQGKPDDVRVAAYVDPLTIAALSDEFAAGELSAFLEVDPSGLDYADADELQTQVRQLAATQLSLPSFGSLLFRSGLGDAVERVVQRVTAASALLALSVSGLLGVLLAVFALGVQSVIARRRPALALAAARGAGALQLRSSMVLEGVLLSIPGAVVAIALATVLIPGPVALLDVLPAVVVAAAPPVLFGAMTSPRRLRELRGDLQVRSRHRMRWVAEVAILALAALSLFLLARRGLVASSAAVGIDPLLSTTPLLLATAVCIGVLRLYPVPLLAVQRLLRTRRGAAGLLGAARAIRDPALGFAAALSLVVGISVVVFSTVMATTIRTGLVQGAQDVVGSDIQVSAAHLPAELVDRIAATDGVRGAVAIAQEAGVALTADGKETEVFVVVADTAALHDIRPDIPALTDRVEGAIPLLVSSDWSTRITDAALELAGRDADNAGEIATDAIPGATRHYVLIDRAFAADVGVNAAAPDRMLIGLEPGAAAHDVAAAVESAVTAAQPAQLRGLVVVTTAQQILDEVRASPTVAAMEGALLLAAGVSLLLTMLTVALASIAAATARNRLVGVLRILGMSPRQLRAIQAWELGPVAITAVLVGTGLGLLLPLIVTSVLDLRPFVGGRYPPGPSIDPLWVGGAIGAFVLVVVLAGVIAAAFGRRFAPAGTLKMGEG
ncbi:MAG TPA: FtsX-like permease family protein [Pseudolysinimonas sp.]|nr:FtsX-like permease family protein [Pseudolysinimonas sp.]